MKRSKVVGFIAGCITAAALGFLIRPSGIHEPPPAQPELATVSAAAPYVAVKESCRTPGHGKVAYCWFEGWQFARKTVCVDSSILGAPLAKLSADYAKAGVRVVVAGKAGACAKLRFPASQRVTFASMTRTAAAKWNYGVCGLTQAANYGTINSITITVYVTGAQRTPCGSGVEWSDVFEHEFGHVLGLSHEQPASTSVMRDSNGHGLDSADKAELNVLYGKRPY